MSSEESPNLTKPVDVEPEKDVLVAPEGEEIDPGKHSPVSKPNRPASLKYATAGLLYVLVCEQSIKFAMIASGITLVVGLSLQISVISWALPVLALGGVWVTECFNTTREASINPGTSDPHPMAKVGKDVAAAAALMSSLVFIVVVALILLPRLTEKLSGS